MFQKKKSVIYLQNPDNQIFKTVNNSVIKNPKTDEPIHIQKNTSRDKWSVQCLQKFLNNTAQTWQIVINKWNVTDRCMNWGRKIFWAYRDIYKLRETARYMCKDKYKQRGKFIYMLAIKINMRLCLHEELTKRSDFCILIN